MLSATRARALLNHAIARGEISRPHTCPRCNTTPRKNATKATQIWATFPEGLQNWRVVQWLCIMCYRRARDA